MSERIYLDAPNVGDMEKRYLARAIDKGYVSVIGPYVHEFEKEFAEYLKAKNAVSVQSGTSAIHNSLHELGIGTGDEVIVPVLTFIATVNPVMYMRATPVFADVDPKTWNIDPREIEKKITKRTKAIIPVHLYGNPCNMDEIMKIARHHKLYVIEDATESLGAEYKGRHTGTFGDLGCFSFNGNKIITTGGGGMVVGRNQERIRHIKFLVNQARNGSEGYYHSEIGFNNRMTNIEAALGLAQLLRLGIFLKQKQENNQIYKKELEDIKILAFQNEYHGATSSYWLNCVIFEEGVNVVEIQRKLNKRGIPTRRIFTPLVEFPPYRSYKKENYENSYWIHRNGLCLPSSSLNSRKGISYVCKSIKQILGV